MTRKFLVEINLGEHEILWLQKIASKKCPNWNSNELNSLIEQNIVRLVSYNGLNEELEITDIGKQILYQLDDIKNKKIYNVAVICVDTQDFLDWKCSNKYEDDMLSSKHKFTYYGKTYYKISSICDTKALVFHDIIETQKGKHIQDYDEIKKCLNQSIAIYKPDGSVWCECKDSTFTVYDDVCHKCGKYRDPSPNKY
jgi:hypothetical protein